MVSHYKRSRIVVSLMVTVMMLVLLPAMAFAASESITDDTRINMFAKLTYPVFDPNNPTFLYPETLAGGVWDYFPSTQASGTGVFNTYLAIQAKGNNDEERGFNTGGTVADFDEGDSKTSALPMTAVPVVTIEGTAYREFAVDINEVSGIPSQYLSTEVLQIWKSSSNNLGGQYDMVNHTFTIPEPKLIYDLDGGFDNGVHSEPAQNRTVILDYGVNTGSGKPDYKVYVPAAWFGDNTGYAVMVVVHGVLGSELEGRDSSDGFEEWGVRVVGTATKTGVKFEDLDADGQPREDGEPGLAGWTIFVDYNDNGVLDPGEPSGDTGLDGSYTINNITPGTFKVREVQKNGWTQSYPALGYHLESFVGGVLYPNNDFGNWRYATKSGMKFEDLNGNGMKNDGEPGVAGVRIDRYTVSAADVLTPAGFTTTDANGAYSFTDMVPGVRYFIAEALPGGWTQSYPNSSTGGDASNAFAGKGYGWDVTLDSGELDSGNNFGNWRYATKSGMKFEDMNGNGAKDNGEMGVEGWRIDRFKVVGGTLVADGSTTTDATGAYSFTNMVPGVRYFIAEELRSGWTQSFPHDTTGGDSSNAYADKGYGWDITLDSNETDSGNNFGNWRYATKSGMKFEDMNANGDKDDGDDGLEGWTIYRYQVVDGSLVADGSTTTDATGAYSFTDMVPGVRYFIAEAHPDGWMQSFPNSSTGGDASNAFAGKGYGWDVTLDSNETDSGNNFGNWQYATKSGTKFEDLNGNGAKDDGEPGIEDWRIDRYTVNDADELTFVDSTMTDENGAYSFDDMMPGVRYFIAEELRTGWTQSYPHGSTGGDASNAFDGKGYGWDVTLESGDTDSGNNFGNWRYATKSGMKFEDMNADGDKDAGDDGLEGWTIYRYKVVEGALVADGSTLTDADGAYSFTDMVPGVRYFIAEEMRADWTQSFPNDDTDGDSSDAFAGKGYGWDVTLDSNETDSGNDFGNWQYATKSGFKFMDENGDGVFDDTEMGLSGWTIQLWTGTPGDLTLVDSDVTDANGFYSFDMIHPGVTYYVSEVIPDPAWIQTFPNGTTAGAVYLTDLGYAWEINLTSGEEHENNNFGNTYYHDETAWAYDGNMPGKAIPFTSIQNKPKFTNWGWTNGPYAAADIGSGYTLDLYAGAGNNVLSNGELVGHVELSYNLDGDLVIHYTMHGSNVLDDIHLWVGADLLPKVKGKYTNSPGQFPYAMADFTADGSGGYTLVIENPPTSFYIAAHAVVRMYETP